MVCQTVYKLYDTNCKMINKFYEAVIRKNRKVQMNDTVISNWNFLFGEWYSMSSINGIL